MDNVYVVSEIYGSSTTSIDDAIGTAIRTASDHVRHLDWFEVTEIRGNIGEDGKVGHYQVGLKLGFRYAPSGQQRGAA